MSEYRALGKNWIKGRGQMVVENQVTSGWWSATNDVSQISILGAILFNQFISDLEAGVECIISNHSKLGDAVDSLEGQATQCHLDRLEHWAMINGMKFNKSKYQILHLGWSNAGHKYKVGEDCLESSSEEKDLGVMAGSSLV
ncbi:rna-directed dna polymerase from mobile element jockey-like [Pitangus sulphuratus]|nr:rna-directed dna polymerase from mobile element jockey-like [Pitangus sulphuratus]